MNVNVIRVAPLTKATKRSADALERIALCMEAICAFNGIRLAPITAEEEHGAAAVDYQTDEMTAVREAEEEAIAMGFKAPKDV